MAEDIQKDKTAFSSGLGTALRLNVDFDLLNDAYYKNNYIEVLKILKIIYRDIWCMPCELDKTTGEIKSNPFLKKSQELKIKCESNFNACLVPQKDGTKNFIPTIQYIENLDAFDMYLRTVAKEYGLYMIMDKDDSETPSLVRKPVMNYRRY